MLNIFISIIAILITIILVVGIHEFGHFIVAKSLGIKVLRFSIGFGKKLITWHDKKGTEYVLAAIPLGGYVKMLDEGEGPVSPAERPFAFNCQPYYKKMAVVIAGPLFNLLFAFIIYWLLFIIGFVSVLPVIGSVTPQSIAADAHLQPQQVIVSIDNKTTHSWTAVLIHLLGRAGDHDTLDMQVKTLNTPTIEQHQLNLANWRLDDLNPDPLHSLGIKPYIPTITPPFRWPEWPSELLYKNHYGPLDAIPHAWQNVSMFVHLNFIILGKMLTGKISLKGLAGPVTIFENAGAALNQGFIAFLSFLAFLSIAIGVINILPVPGLDGGHALFQTIEFILRRPISQRIMFLFYRLGFIALILIMVQALINDFLRI